MERDDASVVTLHAFTKGKMEEQESKAIQEAVLADSVNEVMKEKPSATQNLNDFVQRVSKKFIEKKLDSFPYIVEVFRVQNKLRLDELRQQGNEKGWSEKGDFKFDFDIPSELYYFMVNLVYREFWSEDNEKVWRPFLKALLRGSDPIETLTKVKMIYGSTEAATKAGII